MLCQMISGRDFQSSLVPMTSRDSCVRLYFKTGLHELGQWEIAREQGKTERWVVRILKLGYRSRNAAASFTVNPKARQNMIHVYEVACMSKRNDLHQFGNFVVLTITATTKYLRFDKWVVNCRNKIETQRQ